LQRRRHSGGKRDHAAVVDLGERIDFFVGVADKADEPHDRLQRVG